MFTVTYIDPTGEPASYVKLATIAIAEKQASIAAQWGGTQIAIVDDASGVSTPFDYATAILTYTVHEGNLPSLRERLEGLIKRAGKLGVPPVSFTVGEPSIRKERVCRCEHSCTCQKVDVRYYPVAVSGTSPRFAGWAFGAALEHTDAGNVVRSTPGFTAPEEYRTASAVCSHCETTRKRKDTYLVQNEAGEIRQIGSNCIADFLGHRNPHLIAALATYLIEVRAGLGDPEESFSSSRERGFYLEEYLGYVVREIRQNGWLSKGQARETFGRTASADAAIGLLFPSKGSKIPLEASEMKAASDAVAWVKSVLATKPERSEYEHNLTIVAAKPLIDFRDAGLAASMVSAFNRAMGEIADRAKAPTSEFFGTVEKREVFTLTISQIFDVDGTYGVTHGHRMLDAAGNEAIWFSSSKRLEVGETLQLKATVKAHTVRKGVKQTILTRCTEVQTKGESHAA